MGKEETVKEKQNRAQLWLGPKKNKKNEKAKALLDGFVGGG